MLHVNYISIEKKMGKTGDGTDLWLPNQVVTQTLGSKWLFGQCHIEMTMFKGNYGWFFWLNEPSLTIWAQRKYAIFMPTEIKEWELLMIGINIWHEYHLRKSDMQI